MPGQSFKPSNSEPSKQRSNTTRRKSQVSMLTRGPATASSKASSAADPGKSVPGSKPRYLVETLVVLAVAVSVFRCFVLEGFMITTGSMAPAFLGYHCRVTCTDCKFEFPISARRAKPHVGQTDPSDSSPTVVDQTGGSQVPFAPQTDIHCPNCGHGPITLDEAIVNEGDQLLVDKQAFLWESPQRFDPVVFRNPLHPTEAFAKRIIGLPGEVVTLQHGDVYVNRVIQRKTFAQQREMRILIHDSRFRPQQAASPDGNDETSVSDQASEPIGQFSGWVPEAGSEEYWRQTEHEAKFEPTPDSSQVAPAWLGFQPSVDLGIAQKTAVPLKHWPADLPQSHPQWPVHYDPVEQRLICRGALSPMQAAQLQALSQQASFRAAVEKLYHNSQQQPLTDQLAYNRLAALAAYPIRDYMLEVDLLPAAQQSLATIKMHDGRYQFACQLDFASQTAELKLASDDRVLRTGRLPEMTFGEPVKVEMSIFDRQVLVAVNGHLLFEPYAYRSNGEEPKIMDPPIVLGAAGAPLQLLRQRVYRDVYYRPRHHLSKSPHEVTEYRLNAEEYFVLGDNSAISRDSRDWPAGSVTAALFIGKPIFLHLPSKKRVVQVGPYQTRIRIPDFDRMRIIR